MKAEWFRILTGEVDCVVLAVNGRIAQEHALLPAVIGDEWAGVRKTVESWGWTVELLPEVA